MSLVWGKFCLFSDGILILSVFLFSEFCSRLKLKWAEAEIRREFGAFWEILKIKNVRIK